MRSLILACTVYRLAFLRFPVQNGLESKYVKRNSDGSTRRGTSRDVIRSPRAKSFNTTTNIHPRIHVVATLCRRIVVDATLFRRQVSAKKLPFAHLWTKFRIYIQEERRKQTGLITRLNCLIEALTEIIANIAGPDTDVEWCDACTGPALFAS